MSRAGDLTFGNNARRMLEARARETGLRAYIHAPGAALPAEISARPVIAAKPFEGCATSPPALCVGYRGRPHEAAAGKALDFSPATLDDRRQAGATQMRAAPAAWREARALDEMLRAGLVRLAIGAGNAGIGRYRVTATTAGARGACLLCCTGGACQRGAREYR